MYPGRLHVLLVEPTPLGHKTASELNDATSVWLVMSLSTGISQLVVEKWTVGGTGQLEGGTREVSHK